jgi:hypothetical protein
MLDYYAQREELLTVDGGRSIDEVSWLLVDGIQRLRRALGI